MFLCMIAMSCKETNSSTKNHIIESIKSKSIVNTHIITETDSIIELSNVINDTTLIIYIGDNCCKPCINIALSLVLAINKTNKSSDIVGLVAYNDKLTKWPFYELFKYHGIKLYKSRFPILNESIARPILFTYKAKQISNVMICSAEFQNLFEEYMNKLQAYFDSLKKSGSSLITPHDDDDQYYE